ncbi:MAG: hypothetical protein LUG46_07085 [Erysipelotrichaceae bacterium]|nr:hypothetical protein [Erysipelotrichaceae bacterium]
MYIDKVKSTWSLVDIYSYHLSYKILNYYRERLMEVYRKEIINDISSVTIDILIFDEGDIALTYQQDFNNYHIHIDLFSEDEVIGALVIFDNI